MSARHSLSRRALLAAAACAPWAGCARSDAPRYVGGWVGAQHERGHRLRDLSVNAKSGSTPAPSVQRRAGVVIVGAGIAGLAAARVLRQRGIDDVHVFDLEDSAGGNSRGHVMAGMACPLGAHYLPLPGESAPEVIALLEELGLRSTQAGQPQYDERHLCHSPQERLLIDGQWFEGLLPPIDALPQAQRADTLAQYRRWPRSMASRSRSGWINKACVRRRCAGTSTTAAATTTAPVRRRSRPGPACTTSRAGTAFMLPAMNMKSATACSPGPKATPG